MQPLALTPRRKLGILADLRIKRARRLLLQLLLPGVDLVRMNLMPRRQIGDPRLLPQRLQGDLRLQRRINLPSRLAHVPLRLSRQNSQFPT